MRQLSWVVAGALATLVAATPAAAIDVTTCGQVVIGTGDLRADLDCSAHPGLFSIQLIGRLRLNGFSLRGNPTRPVVYCNTGPCSVTGLGTIWGGREGVASDVGVKLKDVWIDASTGDGVTAQRAVRVTGQTFILRNGGSGIRSRAHVAVIGPAGVSPRAYVGGNGEDGIRSLGNVRLQRAEVDSNGASGIAADGSVMATDSHANDNGLDGARGQRVKLTHTTAIRNGSDAACTSGTDCADVASAQQPQVRGVSLCDASRRLDGSGDWNVCSAD